MAQIKPADWDKLASKFRAAGDRAPELTQKAINRGMDIALTYVRAEMVKKGVRRTGKLMDSVNVSPVKLRAGVAYGDVYPQGMSHYSDRKKQARNETIAFVQEYGRKGSGRKKALQKSANRMEAERKAGKKSVRGYTYTTMAGKYFMKDAYDASEKKIFDAMESVLEEALP